MSWTARHKPLHSYLFYINHSWKKKNEIVSQYVFIKPASSGQSFCRTGKSQAIEPYSLLKIHHISVNVKWGKGRTQKNRRLTNKAFYTKDPRWDRAYSMSLCVSDISTQAGGKVNPPCTHNTHAPRYEHPRVTHTPHMQGRAAAAQSIKHPQSVTHKQPQLHQPAGSPRLPF